MTDTIIENEPQLHVRYDGESIDVPLRNVDIGDISTDSDIRRAAANYLNVPESKFDNFTVDKNASTGDVTLRPQAVFG